MSSLYDEGKTIECLTGAIKALTSIMYEDREYYEHYVEELKAEILELKKSCCLQMCGHPDCKVCFPFSERVKQMSLFDPMKD